MPSGIFTIIVVPVVLIIIALFVGFTKGNA